MSKIKFKVSSGGASIDLSGRALDMFNELVDLIAPDTKKALEDYVTDLEQHARRNWIVRAKNSNRSIDKFYKVFFVTPDFRISAGVGNSAPYAFAIKVGEKSKTKVPVGKTLAIEVLWKPAQKRLDKLVEIVANEIAKSARKV
jgi:hypothetical protein